MRNPRSNPDKGPFYVNQTTEGDRFEMDHGKPIYCAPTGGDGSRRVGVGFEVLETDPAVESAGIDTGYALDDKTLWAPDIAVGAVPDAPGWVRGSVPPLAVEYAGATQSEPDLQTKIGDLLAAGTRWVWVVRLTGPRRIEVYEKDRPVRTFSHGDQLTAPGLLQNPVPVDALFDREASHEAVLRNLLQRRGYGSLDEVRQEGERAGRQEGERAGRQEGERAGRQEGERVGLREAALQVCELLAIPLTAEHRAHIEQLDAGGLRALIERLRRDRRWD